MNDYKKVGLYNINLNIVLSFHKNVIKTDEPLKILNRNESGICILRTSQYTGIHWVTVNILIKINNITKYINIEMGKGCNLELIYFMKTYPNFPLIIENELIKYYLRPVDDNIKYSRRILNEFIETENPLKYSEKFYDFIMYGTEILKDDSDVIGNIFIIIIDDIEIKGKITSIYGYTHNLKKKTQISYDYDELLNSEEFIYPQLVR